MSAPQEFQAALARLALGAEAVEGDLDLLFSVVMDGGATPAQIGAFLTALKRRGEDAAVIAAGARALRARMTPLATTLDTVDLCGTGGDGAGSLNISTAAALIAAACGLPVAKHGNRAMSSRSGAADVLEALGYPLEATPERLAKTLEAAGCAFLFAQTFHPAMRHVAGPRRELGFRTVFNLLGPLSSPAGARRQLLGVYDAALLTPMAQALAALGAKAAWVVHGYGGLDELSLEGPNQVAVLADGTVRALTVTAADAGLPTSPNAALAGGAPAANAAALQALLDGAHGPYREAAVFNAAAALSMAEGQPLAGAAARAGAAVSSGAAKTVLTRMIAEARRA